MKDNVHPLAEILWLKGLKERWHFHSDEKKTDEIINHRSKEFSSLLNEAKTYLNSAEKGAIRLKSSNTTIMDIVAARRKVMFAIHESKGYPCTIEKLESAERRLKAIRKSTDDFSDLSNQVAGDCFASLDIIQRLLKLAKKECPF
jgi:hypothetical protein